MKANSVINKIETWGNNRWILWGIWAAYTMLVVALCSIHEPWGDEHNVWSMVYRLSFSELWDAMRGEGHFCLWHLCVWPWVNLFGMDYHALFVASTILMSGAVWLLLFKLDFSFIGKLLIVFSAPFFYDFPVVSRCYALIPLILIALAIVYQKQKNPFLYCLLIGLLAHTHAYMEGMVGVLWCLFVYFYVYVPFKNNERQRAKKNMGASLITIVLVLLAFLQIMGGITDAAEGTSVAFNKVNHTTDWLLYVYEKHHIQLSMTLHQHISTLIPKIDLPITLLLYIAITILLYKLLLASEKKVESTWVLLVSIIWQILFAINIYSMWFQRVYLLYLPILYVLWITYKYDKTPQRYATYIIACIWLLNTPARYDILQDITKEYCFDVSVAKQLDNNITENYPIISYAEESSRLLDKEILFVYDQTLKGQSFDTFLLSVYPDDSILYVITSYNMDSIDNNKLTIERIYSGIEGNHEFTGIGYEKEVGLYNVIRHD